jgi:hypothetical protein
MTNETKAGVEDTRDGAAQGVAPAERIGDLIDSLSRKPRRPFVTSMTSPTTTPVPADPRLTTRVLTIILASDY